MLTLTHPVSGSTATIRVAQGAADARDFLDWSADRARTGEPVAYDTETTDLDAWRRGFRVRLGQFGTGSEAWVLPVERGAGEDVARALRLLPALTAHNGKFDQHASEQEHTIGVTVEELTHKLTDTAILSKLVEPHRPGGHGLKSLATQYVDPSAEDTADGLVERFRLHGLTKETGWAGIPLDDELYLRYAGLDVVYTARLLPKLLELVRLRRVGHLAEFEHTTQARLNVLRRRGMLVDVPYALDRAAILQADADAHLATVRDDYGLENLNSPKQVAEAFERAGTPLTERNPRKRDPKTHEWRPGSLKTGKEVLLPLAGFDEYWNPVPGFVGASPLAEHIALGKRSDAFANRYLGKFVELAEGGDGRLHADVTGLQARTSRMAVSDPPLQQLPAGDWQVRRAVVADPGQVIVSADYAQVEMRIIAQLAGITRMKEAILEGVDLHARTAELAYGPGWTKEQRTHLKGAGFGRVFGGGAKGLARKMGLTDAQAKRIVDTYDRTYPELKRWSKKLERDARANGMVLRSATGRILALDRDRVYAGVNYNVQSLAADVMKNALEAIWDAGLADHVLMPVHDEVVAQAPLADADDVAHAIAAAMQTSIGNIPLDSDAEVYGPSWGHGYGKVGEMGEWY